MVKIIGFSQMGNVIIQIPPIYGVLYHFKAFRDRKPYFFPIARIKPPIQKQRFTALDRQSLLCLILSSVARKTFLATFRFDSRSINKSTAASPIISV